MEFLVDLWLPILLSAVLVFLASSVFHMLLPIHKGDYKELPDEEGILAAMRDSNITPDDYVFPYCASMKDLGNQETMDKYKQGPVGFLTILPSGPPTIGVAMVQWFVYLLIIGIFVAYIGRMALGNGEAYMKVFRMTGAVAVLIHVFCDFSSSIWRGLKWSTSFKYAFDGLIYALLTAGTFSWLWPE